MGCRKEAKGAWWGQVKMVHFALLFYLPSLSNSESGKQVSVRGRGSGEKPSGSSPSLQRSQGSLSCTVSGGQISASQLPPARSRESRNAQHIQCPGVFNSGLLCKKPKKPQGGMIIKR